MELHKRRKALSEPEVRYYLRQTLMAVKYLHDVKVCGLLSPSTHPKLLVLHPVFNSQ